jgi:hypothetical protein
MAAWKVTAPAISAARESSTRRTVADDGARSDPGPESVFCRICNTRVVLVK